MIRVDMIAESRFDRDWSGSSRDSIERRLIRGEGRELGWKREKLGRRQRSEGRIFSESLVAER